MLDVEDPNDPLALPASIEVFLNPTSLRLRSAADWASINIPGLSHQVLQWSHSSAYRISFTLLWSYLEATRRVNSETVRAKEDEADPIPKIAIAKLTTAYRRFLLALTSPLEPGAAPSRATLIWPGFLEITGVATSVNFQFTQFAEEGYPMAFRADIDMTELRTFFRNRAGTDFVGNTDGGQITRAAFEAIEELRTLDIEGVLGGTGGT